MKIDTTSNVQMLYKGVVDNSDKYTKGKETERQKAALDTKQSVSSFVENKGAYFDTKA
ncbi:MAG TPA: hypothetical protein PKG60_13890 [Spirochaetota bacterium]|nr:hypothetical protein [Spirochaetota bacterium]HPS88244.1 hypothetical protein [Spirochaetota bacterium]